MTQLKDNISNNNTIIQNSAKTLTRRSPSPFSDNVKTPLKSGSNVCKNNEHGYLMRTRSLDDEQQQLHNTQQIRHYQQQRSQEEDDIDMCSGEEEEGSSCCEDAATVVGTTTALHSSFDAFILRGGTNSSSCNSSSGNTTLFENGLDDEGCGGGACGGIDDRMIDGSTSLFDRGEELSSSGMKKHHLRRPRRAASGGSYQDLKPPGTTRKKNLRNTARRRSSDTATTVGTTATSSSLSSPSFSLSKTPVRPLYVGNDTNGNSNNTNATVVRTPANNKNKVKSPFAHNRKSPGPAPSSTAKRRLAPLVYPARQSPMRRVAGDSSSKTTTPTPFPPPALFGTGSMNNKNNVATSTHNQHYPASTPTHQNLSNGPHGTIVKKMSYYTGTTAGTDLSKQPSKSMPLETTFEIDAESVNTNSPARFRFTSFPASLPRVAHNPRTTPPVFPGSVRKRMSFDTEDDTGGNGGVSAIAAAAIFNNPNNPDANQSRDDEGTQNTSLSSLSVEGGHHQHLPHLPNQHPPHFASVPMEKLLLFPGENNNHHNHELINNNLFGYSDDEEDEAAAAAADDQIGAVGRTRLNFNVFLSPGHDKKSKNHNSKENGFGSRRIDLNENVDLSRPYEQNRINSFPSSISSHTQMNASAIEDMISSNLSPPRTTEKGDPPDTPREVQVHFPLESECSPILGAKDDVIATAIDRHHENSSETSSVLVGDRLMPKTSISSSSHFGFSTKHGSQKGEGSSTSSESTTTTQRRRLRPMPDMSAFENVKTSTRGDRSMDDSTNTAGESRVMPSMKLRACPPTPQRTPAWAKEGGPHAFFQTRQNSLIMTKVLLSCPSQVLKGRSSLEDSVLDEDDKAGGMRRRSLPNINCDRVSGTGNNNKNPPPLPSMLMDIEKCDPIGPSASIDDKQFKTSRVQIAAPPKLMRRLPSPTQDVNAVISFSDDFEILSSLGSGTFADVYKVRLKSDDHLYAVKRNRRQFRGKRDRDMALAEVQSMQRLQSVFANTSDENSHNANLEKNCYSLYLLFFHRAWQEDGYFYSQTELCCRDTCREMLDSLRFLWNSSKMIYPSLVKNLPPPSGVQAGSQLDAFGRIVPNMTVWKICHDISAGLSHIHSHGIVHQDIKPSNIFLVANARFGAMCKIGDFGMAGSIGSSGDGQEGDARYMPPELLTSATRHTSSDIFSLGLTLYEIAMDENIEMPSEGPHWHQLRSSNEPKLPSCRGDNLQLLLQSMTNPDETRRPTADTILENENVNIAGHDVDTFLQDYIKDAEEYDRKEEIRLADHQTDEQTPRNGQRPTVRSPSLHMLIPAPPTLFSPPAKFIQS
jgi:membrane-associated tyrosine/threonine-specific cdc2-inhibitory kinase